jgi:hypothetical protein
MQAIARRWVWLSRWEDGRWGGLDVSRCGPVRFTSPLLCGNQLESNPISSFDHESCERASDEALMFGLLHGDQRSILFFQHLSVLRQYYSINFNSFALLQACGDDVWEVSSHPLLRR